MKLIHLSDLHVVAAPELVYGLDPRQRTRAAIADINAHHADAAGVIISGDLTDRGEPGAYDTLKEIIGELMPPVFLGIGNHDDRGAFQTAFGDVARDPQGFCQYSWTIDGSRFLMLDSVEAGSDAGKLCEQRLAWLDAELAVDPNRPAYLFLHHNPAPCGLPHEDKIMLQDAQKLADVLARHPQVRHLAFGHVHRCYSGTWRGVAYASIAGMNHQTALDFTAALTGSPGSHEPPAYGVMLIDEAGDVTYHYHQFLDGNLKYFYDGALNQAPTYGAFVDLVEQQRAKAQTRATGGD